MLVPKSACPEYNYRPPLPPPNLHAPDPCTAARSIFSFFFSQEGDGEDGREKINYYVFFLSREIFIVEIGLPF